MVWIKAISFRAERHRDDADADRLYVKSLSVPKDYVKARKWLNIADESGSAEAAAGRDALVRNLTEVVCRSHSA